MKLTAREKARQKERVAEVQRTLNAINYADYVFRVEQSIRAKSKIQDEIRVHSQAARMSYSIKKGTNK